MLMERRWSASRETATKGMTTGWIGEKRRRIHGVYYSMETAMWHLVMLVNRVSDLLDGL